MRQTGISSIATKATLAQGIAAGTPVLTMDGAIPVEFLSPGDRVVTRAGMRVLRAVTLSGSGSVPGGTPVAAIRIGAETLAVGVPGDDILVAPDQPVLVRDWRAMALAGQPAAMIAACRLVDGQFIRAEAVAGLRLFVLAFDAPCSIYAGGVELGCPGIAVPA